MSDNLTVAAGGEKYLADGKFSMYLGEICQIHEKPGLGIGPEGRYKLYELEIIPTPAWQSGGYVSPYKMPQRCGEFTFEGFVNSHSQGYLMEVYDTMLEAVINWTKKYELC